MNGVATATLQLVCEKGGAGIYRFRPPFTYAPLVRDQNAASSPPQRSQYHSVGRFIVLHSVQRSVFC